MDDAMTMRIIDTGPGKAAFNMAMDSVLAHRVATGASGPVFRIYTWAERAISIGFSQYPAHVLDIERCRQDGVPVVRRPTGGRAVLHGDDLSYSLVISADDPILGGTLRESCRQISMMLRDALRHVGIDASIGKQYRSVYEKDGVGSPPCFMSTSRFEITAGGKKIAGLAQRRMNGVLLQQGTILMHVGQKDIARYLTGTGDGIPVTIDTDDNCTGVCDTAGCDTSVETVKDALCSVLRTYYNSDVEFTIPFTGETDEAKRICEVFDITGGSGLWKTILDLTLPI